MGDAFLHPSLVVPKSPGCVPKLYVGVLYCVSVLLLELFVFHEDGDCALLSILYHCPKALVPFGPLVIFALLSLFLSSTFGPVFHIRFLSLP